MSRSLAPTEPVPDDLIVSDDPARPSAALIADIRARLSTRSVEGGEPLPSFPRFGGELSDAPDADVAAQHLALAADLLSQLDVPLTLAPSPATRLPVVGRLWALIREQAHSLVLFYVNKQMTQTAQVQGHLLAALHGLAAESRRQREALAKLQQAPDHDGALSREGE